MKYILFNTGPDVVESLVLSVKEMCKENNINYDKQQYSVLFSKEKLLFKNNGVNFTSGSKKYLCFYGRVYSNKKGKIVETIHLKDKIISLEPDINNSLIIFGGINNSSVLENDEELLHFYVAPKSLLGLQDLALWQTI